MLTLFFYLKTRNIDDNNKYFIIYLYGIRKVSILKLITLT